MLGWGVLNEEMSVALLVNEAATAALVAWAEATFHGSETYFHKAQKLARKLGAYYRPDGLTEVGFWAPELAPGTIQPKDIYLEVLTPLTPVDLRAAEQTVAFCCERLSLQQQGEYFWGVIEGMQPGTKAQLGSLYWLRYLNEQFEGEVSRQQFNTIHDVLAGSLPYGVFAPAELYDFDRLNAQRRDRDYFSLGHRNADGVIQVPTPAHILQMHVSTASAEGSLAGLTRIYQRLAAKLVAGETLTAAEQNYVGYDAVQLLPIEPTIEFRGEPFWASDDATALEQTITLRKSDTQNWGYDIVISGMAATNPSILESLRPDELIEFIETLHTFPTGPIRLIYDIVYGHADNQAQELQNGRYLKGPNMYGQDVNHQNPTVRAILLEMQRRRINSGADGIRVDGAQDFKFFNPLSGYVEYDDAYLTEMYNVHQEIAGETRQLFSIFEDGRPWPQEGWETSSTYREVIAFLPQTYQWGPLIFAHNTPALEAFWDYKWARLCEVMHHGDHWITGCGNHDTVRRGTQIDPKMPINWNLGKTLPEVLDNAYNNPATMLLTYGFCPGLPMDFINALMHAPWGFIRNTDDYYGVKVVAEEAGFLDWQIEPETYAEAANFPRLKAFGFGAYSELRDFCHALRDAMVAKDYDLGAVAEICQTCLGSEIDPATWNQALACPPGGIALRQLNRPGKAAALHDLDVPKLKAFARAFMEDAHEVCNVSLYTERVDAARAVFNAVLRQFRRQHAWLRENLDGRDRFNRVSGSDYTVFYGLRQSQVGDKVAFVAHMGGKPAQITLADWLQLDMAAWSIAIASPGLVMDSLVHFELRDSQAVLLRPR